MAKLVEVHYQGKPYNKEIIKNRLLTDNAWLNRGILAIYQHQTLDEKLDGNTKEDNGIGFNGADAVILSSFAQQLILKKYLTEKQYAIARKKMVKYSGQLLNIIKSKSENRDA